MNDVQSIATAGAMAWAITQQVKKALRLRPEYVRLFALLVSVAVIFINPASKDGSIIDKLWLGLLAWLSAIGGHEALVTNSSK